MEDNKTLRLLRILGSPMSIGSQAELSSADALDLFEYAFENRIALLYLDSLREKKALSSLNAQYREQNNRYEQSEVTVARLAELLNKAGFRYAIMKTLKPYRATPNDVDVLFLDEDAKFKEAMKILKEKGYTFLQMAPCQAEFYDPRAKSIRHDKTGGIYHIDLYRELAADYVVYLDKKRLMRYRETVTILDVQVHVFSPEAELAIVLMHSVFPEQSYQLQDFYSTLHFLDKMETEQIKNFINIVTGNHITTAVRASLTLTAVLHEAAFGVVPQKLSTILEKIGGQTKEGFFLFRKHFETPYIYSFWTFFKTFCERALDKRGFASFFVQGLHMLNPLFFYNVVDVVRRKQIEGTYKAK